MLTEKIKSKLDALTVYSYDVREGSWSKDEFKKLTFSEKHLAPKTNTAISNFGSEISAFIMFAEELKKGGEEKDIVNKITFQNYIDKYRNDFVAGLSTDAIKNCGKNYSGIYLLLRSVTDVMHKFTIPENVVANCNELVDEVMNLNYLQHYLIQKMFDSIDYNWTLANFFTRPDNISKGEEPKAYAHFFNELTGELRAETGLTMKDYINLNLKSINLQTFMNNGDIKSIPSQIACYKLGNRDEGLIESAIFREIDVYSLALQLGPETAIKTFISLSEYFEEYNKSNNLNRRDNCEKAYKRITIPQWIIDDIIIDEQNDMPLDWAVELHMEELREETLMQYVNIINS